MAWTKWDLEGWRIDAGKWMDGLLFTYYEDDWVFYRLEGSKYDGIDTDIIIQHDYLDADGHYGVDGATNFFVGPQTGRKTTPGSIPTIYPEGGTVFHVEGPTVVPVPNGSMLEYHIIVDDEAALVAMGDFAFYWEAHCSLTGSTGFHWGETIDFGSSYWNGASLHTHTGVTGNQDVPIKTPPQIGPPPSIDVEKYVKVDCTNWLDADDPPGPEVQRCDDIFYMYVVTNTGAVELTNIVLTDSDVGIVAIPTNVLPAGGSFQVEIGPLDAFPEQHTNTATATGEYGGQTYQDTDDANYDGTRCQ
jgi:hypothetical protein